MKRLRSTAKYKKRSKRFLDHELGRTQSEPVVLDETSFNERLLEERSKNEPQLAIDLDFLHLADPYVGVGRFENPTEKAKVLADFYHKFDYQGTYPLVDKHSDRIRSPGVVGKIFDEVCGTVAERVGYA